MPNWITNKIAAPKHVIKAMLNAEGRIDFATMAPFPGPRDEWNDYAVDAEDAAKIVCGIPVSSHPLIASLEQHSRASFDIRKLSDESFQQFVGFVENYRACGYLHSMDFARQAWGTKWNACEQKHNADAGTAEFETAWSCPAPVLVLLSKRFPDDEISVTFADEDIGSNCGTFTLKAGAVIASDIAPAWRDMTEEQRAKWKAFAYQVRGWSPEDIADAEADD
ncbi:hypothetical protein CS062_17360 [Roseateles chitinivorans]|uniref:YubB ferredoxin-like domain-containing protein n=1 Tax=Roseateles chitinivorans TaxID=2917965 RepID=A0A2G9C640_9BURK|nr:hypothetical protein [Roseateles chitinivorans]PIM51893.1 hypothetical protein CS062_17360 [Roseateles chitinivorans]